MTNYIHNREQGDSFPYPKSCAVQGMAILAAEACLPDGSQSGAVSQKLPGLLRRSLVSALPHIA